MTASLTVIDHPFIQHKLTIMRDRATPSVDFRRLLREISMLMCYEVTRDLPLEPLAVETPVAPAIGARLAGKKLAFASILRAGEGFLQGMLDLAPNARVAHIGVYRDPKTLQAVEYYFKAPADLHERLVIVLDPMLATGNSAIAAISRLKARGAEQMRFVCLVAAPEGVAALNAASPDTPIFTAALDDRLNEKGYITPGLGDAGDRIFGTK